jgi:hypothetical protein
MYTFSTYPSMYNSSTYISYIAPPPDTPPHTHLRWALIIYIPDTSCNRDLHACGEVE